MFYTELLFLAAVLLRAAGRRQWHHDCICSFCDRFWCHMTGCLFKTLDNCSLTMVPGTFS